MKPHLLLIITILGVLPSAASAGDAAAEGATGAAIEFESADDRFETALAAVNRNESEPDVSSLEELWRRAADAGVPRKALYAFDGVIASNPLDSEEAAVARRALADLERLAAGTDGVDALHAANPQAVDPERIDALRLAIDRDRVGGDQIEAIAELSLYRGDEVVAALDEAARRALPPARLAAVRALWVVAADCQDRAPLEARLADFARADDPGVAQLAARALADLDAARPEGGRP